mgnify:CR=1 FL=1
MDKHDYIDIYDLTEKITRAILMGQEVYVVNNGKMNAHVLDLPTPQTSGTWTQRESYARMKAQVLVDRYNKMKTQIYNDENKEN